MSLNSKGVDTDIYRTIIIGNNNNGKIIEIPGEVVDKLSRFKAIGYDQNTTTVFRDDGAVEIYGTTRFE